MVAVELLDKYGVQVGKAFSTITEPQSLPTVPDDWDDWASRDFC